MIESGARASQVISARAEYLPVVVRSVYTARVSCDSHTVYTDSSKTRKAHASFSGMTMCAVARHEQFIQFVQVALVLALVV